MSPLAQWPCCLGAQSSTQLVTAQFSVIMSVDAPPRTFSTLPNTGWYIKRGVNTAALQWLQALSRRPAQSPPCLPPLPFTLTKTAHRRQQLEAPHLTATLPLVPPLVSTGTGLAFADEELASVANPEATGTLDAQTGGACLPPPPANGIVVCATSGRHPPVKRLKKKKKWTPFEDVAGRLARAVSVRRGRETYAYIRVRACVYVCMYACVGGSDVSRESS